MIEPLFEYDVSAIAALLPDLEEAFAEERWRQTMPHTPHAGSETIFIRRQPGLRPRDVLHQIASVATRHMAHPALAEALETISLRLEGRLARVLLTRLPPGAVIAEHADAGIYAESTVRYHLPIVTNEGAWLGFGEQRFRLLPGVLYAFDKHIPHRGANDGGTPRVHLIIDVHPDACGTMA